MKCQVCGIDFKFAVFLGKDDKEYTVWWCSSCGRKWLQNGHRITRI